jgi:hypothetical protein
MGLTVSKMCAKSTKKIKKIKRRLSRDKKVEIIYKQISGNDPYEVYKDRYSDEEETYTIQI